MTSQQNRRIRKRLADAARLTSEAADIAEAGRANYSLREIVARAADDMSAAIRALDMMDARDRMAAESAMRDINDRGEIG